MLVVSWCCTRHSTGRCSPPSSGALTLRRLSGCRPDIPAVPATNRPTSQNGEAGRFHDWSIRLCVRGHRSLVFLGEQPEPQVGFAAPGAQQLPAPHALMTESGLLQRPDRAHVAGVDPCLQAVETKGAESNAAGDTDRGGGDPTTPARPLADEIAEVGAAVMRVDRPDLEVADVFALGLDGEE